uniref:Uncharacterized protein n=1 Tax=Oryza meridionalis TaxID=40149 RepID=A0A0E0CLR2_9ORYZ
MATPVGAVFLLEGIVLCSTRFFGLRLEDPALRCLWSVHQKSKLLLATMTYVLLHWCRRKFFSLFSVWVLPGFPLKPCLCEVFGPGFPLKTGPSLFFFNENRLFLSSFEVFPKKKKCVN